MTADPRTLDLFPSEEISLDSEAKKLQSRNVEGSPGRDPLLTSPTLKNVQGSRPSFLPLEALPLPRSEDNYGLVGLRAVGFNECLKEISKNIRGIGKSTQER